MKVHNILLQNTIIYLASSLIVGLIPFVLLPILTNYLSPVELGRIGLLELGIAFGFPLISLGLQGALNVEFFKRSKSDFSEYVFSVSLLPVIAVVLILLIIVAMELFISIEYAVPTMWIVLIPVISICQYFYQTWLIIVQCEKRPFTYGMMQLLMVLLNFGVSIVLIIYRDMQAEGRLFGIVFAFLIVGTLSFFMLYKSGYMKFKFRLHYAYDGLRYGLPLIPHLIGGMSIVFLDRYFITNILGTRDLGIYVVAVQISFSLIFIQNALNQAMLPFVFEKLSLNSTEGDVMVKRIFSSYIVFMLLAAISLCLASPYIYKYFIGDEFLTSQYLVKYLVFSMFILACSKIFINIIMYEKKTFALSIIAMISVILAWILYSLFIKNYGLIGAAFTSIMLSMVALIFSAFFTSKIRRLNWRKGLSE